MKKKWLVKIDYLCARKIYCFLIIYLIIIGVLPYPYATSIGINDNMIFYNNSFFFFYQYVFSIFISEITSSVFLEICKPVSSMFIKTLHVSAFELVWKRIINLYFTIALPYVAMIVYGVHRINLSIYATAANSAALNGVLVPFVNWRVPLTHCLVGLLFYIIANLSLLTIFRSKRTTMMIVLAYCVMEAGPFPAILGKYTLFNGAFTRPDFFSILPANVVIQIILLCLMLGWISLWISKNL